MRKILDNLIWWKYGRETTVYVLFCLLIVAFIFLTPKQWFESREKLATQTSRIVVKASDVSPDREHLAQRVREISGDPNAEILGIEESVGEKGEKVYQIDIR